MDGCILTAIYGDGCGQKMTVCIFLDFGDSVMQTVIYADDNGCFAVVYSGFCAAAGGFPPDAERLFGKRVGRCRSGLCGFRVAVNDSTAIAPNSRTSSSADRRFFM